MWFHYCLNRLNTFCSLKSHLHFRLLPIVKSKVSQSHLGTEFWSKQSVLDIEPIEYDFPKNDGTIFFQKSQSTTLCKQSLNTCRRMKITRVFSCRMNELRWDRIFVFWLEGLSTTCFTTFVRGFSFQTTCWQFWTETTTAAAATAQYSRMWKKCYFDHMVQWVLAQHLIC